MIRSSLRLLALFSSVACTSLSYAVTIKSQDPSFAYVPPATSFQFAACSLTDPYLDRGKVIADDGCYGFINQTGTTITSLTLSFENTAAIQQSGSNNAFTDNFTTATFTATTDPRNASQLYTFSFSGGPGIANNVAFVISEDGVNYADFPLVSLSYTTVTPEPSSALLIATGMVCLAGFAFQRRRA